jgi:hypothetical protein
MKKRQEQETHYIWSLGRLKGRYFDPLKVGRSGLAEHSFVCMTVNHTADIGLPPGAAGPV